MSVTAPEGFVASGCHAGIKRRRFDMALLATEDRKPVPCAAVFTQNKFVAPPVELDRALLGASGGKAAAVIVNSGNANAGTGEAGYRDAEAMGAAAADALGIDKGGVLVCSTGIIGTPLAMKPILAALARQLPGELRRGFQDQVHRQRRADDPGRADQNLARIDAECVARSSAHELSVLVARCSGARVGVAGIDDDR